MKIPNHLKQPVTITDDTRAMFEKIEQNISRAEYDAVTLNTANALESALIAMQPYMIDGSWYVCNCIGSTTGDDDGEPVIDTQRPLAGPYDDEGSAWTWIRDLAIASGVGI